MIKLPTKAAFKLGLLGFVFNEEIIPLTTQARFSWGMITQSGHLAKKKRKADFCVFFENFQTALINSMPLESKYNSGDVSCVRKQLHGLHCDMTVEEFLFQECELLRRQVLSLVVLKKHKRER